MSQSQPSFGHKIEATCLGGDTVNLPVIQLCFDAEKC